MSINKSTIHKLGLYLFAAGLILGMIFQGGSLWADFEASLFDSTLPSDWADTTLNTYSCPHVISSKETGTVKASFKNETDKDINLRIRVHTSEGWVTLLREETTILPIAPGETSTAEWLVYPENAAWGHFILVRIFQFRAFQTPSRSASCGVLVLDIFNLSGSQIVILLLTLSLAGMLSGIGLFVYTTTPLRGRNLSIIAAMIVLLILTVVGIFFSFIGSWAVVGTLLVTIIMLIALLPFAFRMQAI